ncbi:MAG: oligoribonuclease [Enterobacteriaceae bacterium]
MKKNSNLIWIDLEMTGLNVYYDKIIEIATVITDNYLNILAEGPSLVINQSEKQLKLMNNWNVKVHTNNGLIHQIRKSKINEITAEKETIFFLEKWVPPNCSPICGSSIGQDRKFLFYHMPALESYFHYRCIDVSTVKELVYRWRPNLIKKNKKRNIHRALQDIYFSIKELLFYRKYFINL